LLRTSGAIVGGLLLGIGSQVLILPMLDTIAGFTVMFAAVTGVAAWFITSSPRLSYFGSQLALAFYFIQLRGPSPQTNLGIARDNTLGILLGLTMMWLVFETLGAKPAVQVMRELFAENLHPMAEYARPWPQGKPADLQKIRTLREKISQNFLGVVSQADAVLFEIGKSRDHSLAVRHQLLGWQPQFRSLAVPAAGLSAGAACPHPARRATPRQ
jgi:multidrug resistance protein MdtO